MSNTLKFLSVLMLSLAINACKNDKESTTNDVKTSVRFKLSSTSFDSGAVIPNKYTCSVGSQIFPHIAWNDNGKSPASYVLILDDPDAVPVAGYVWNHWLLYDIPSTAMSIGEGTDALNPLPAGTKRGKTSFGDTAYGGPCPPSGQLHHYFIKLYQMDIKSLGIASGSDVATVRGKMKGHIIDSAEYVGTFQR